MYKYSIILILFVLFNTPLYQQGMSDNYCGMDTSLVPGIEKALSGGQYKPSCNAQGEFLRVLIVYAQFYQDSVASANWPSDQLPNWAYNLVDSVPAQTYRPITLSDYFKKMSNGNFDFIGDVYPSLIKLGNYCDYQNANQQIFNYLYKRHFRFKRYDNWKLQNGGFAFSENNGDGYADMIIIIYRHADSTFGIGGGIATLGYYNDITTFDGTKIGGGACNVHASGITTQAKAERNKDEKFMVYHLAHEYGHYLFGGGHTRTSGIMAGYPCNYDGNGYAMNTWERTFLGYISPFTNIYNGYIKTLRDYVTTGDALKIQLRNANEYLIIENHQKKTFYDQIIRGGGLQGSWEQNDVGKGIYVWYVKDVSNILPDIFAVTADGGWNWKFGGYMPMPAGWPDSLLLIDRNGSNRILGSGLGDRNSNLFTKDGTDYDRWHERNTVTKEWVLSREVLGDETDAFNINTNRFLTPWSNPSTRPQNDNTSFLTIQICSQSGDDVTLRINTTESAALSLPPSPPQNVQVTTVNGQHPTLTWDSNIEPDMKRGGKYKIYKSLYLDEPGYDLLVATVNHDSTAAIQSYTDIGTTCGNLRSYFYKVTALDSTFAESRASDTVCVISNSPWLWKQSRAHKIAEKDSLLLNYPNPFNPQTKISFNLASRTKTKLCIYDILGKEVLTLVNGIIGPGFYEITFDGTKLSSGVYLYELRTDNGRIIKKMNLIK